jgi:hypothetical protein
VNDDLDDRLREALRPLRSVPVPPMPRLEARAEAPRRALRRGWIAAVAAAALVAALGVWFRRPVPEQVSPATRLLGDLDRLEERIRSSPRTPQRAALEDELRLVRHELAVLAAALPSSTLPK